MDGLDRLLADRVLGQAPKLAFLFLWRECGFDVNDEIVVEDTDLGRRLGRDRRSAQDWLRALEGAGLIEIRRRDRRRGVYWITVPPGRREPTPDGQGRLPLKDDSPAGEPTPRAGSRADCGEPTPRNSALDARQGRAGISTQKSPRPYGTKENLNFILPNSQRNQSTKEGVGSLESRSGAGISARKSPRDFGGERTALIGQDTAIVAAALAADSPAQQRRRLMARIQAVVREPLTEWVLGSAANLVAIHGVPVKELDLILGDVEAMRAAGGLRNGPAAFFHFKARELALRHGINWPRRATRTREMQEAGAGT
jgi:DNA-binding transcriptional ArsR family regulator